MNIVMCRFKTVEKDDTSTDQYPEPWETSGSKKFSVGRLCRLILRVVLSSSTDGRQRRCTKTGLHRKTSAENIVLQGS